MGLRKTKPTSPARREMSFSDFKDLQGEQTPVKSLLKTVTRSGGRNNNGRITVRHRGGGVKRKSRLVDFRMNKIGIPAKVAGIQYDPTRSARVALLHYADGEKRYILAPNKLLVGDTVISNYKADIKVGNRMPLKNIPDGTILHNIEMKPGKGGQIARAAGTYAQLMAKEGKYALLRMPSKELRKVLVENWATIGQVGNTDHENITIGKAGRKRYLGFRPKVRGAAMNPVDHPHGGGEGRSSGGRHPCTPWGVPTKGKKTRSNKRTDKFIVKRRRK